MRDHRGHWIARRLRPGGPAPVRIVRLLGSAQPEQRGILVGDLARLSQVPSLGRESISRGRGGTRARGVHLRGRGLGRRRGGQRAPWPAGPAGGAATSAPPGAGSPGPWGAAPVCDPHVLGRGVGGGGRRRRPCGTSHLALSPPICPRIPAAPPFGDFNRSPPSAARLSSPRTAGIVCGTSQGC